MALFLKHRLRALIGISVRGPAISMSASVLRLDLKSDRGRGTGGAKGQEDRAGPACRPVSLLAFVEEENRELRRAVIDLALDTLLLREAVPRIER